MAKNDNYIGLAMGLDVTDLKSGLQETKKEIATANKEFKAVTSGMDDWTQSSEGLNAKLKQLDTTLKNQIKQYDGISAELEQARRKYGDNSEQVRRLNDQLLDVTASIGRTEKAQRKYTNQLNELESETKQATTATDKLSKEMKDADKASGSLKEGFTVLKGVVAGLVTTGINSLISGLQSVVSESREFRREMAYLNSTADAMGVSFDHAKDAVKEVTSITEDQGAAIEGLNNIMSAGFDGNALDEITDQLIGASIKWKDTLKFEGLADGLQETLATGSAVGPFSELLERAGLDLDEFNAGLAEATTSADKQNFVLQTLSSLGLKEIKDGYVEANKTLVDGARANIEYSEAMAEVGEVAEPVLTSVKMGFANVLQAIFDTGEGMDTANISGKISEAFQWFIETCVPFIQQALTWMIENFKAVVTVVGLVGGAFVAWKVASVLKDVVSGVKDFKKWLDTARNSTVLFTVAEKARAVATGIATTVTNGAKLAFQALNMVMRANPILLIVSLIAILVTAFITLWNKSEAFRQFWINLWNGIKAVAKTVIDWLAKAFTIAWDIIKKVWSVVVGFFTGIWNGIKAVFSTVISFFSGIFSGAWNAIVRVWNAVVGFFTGIFNGIVSVFTDIPNKIGGFFTDAWNKITGVFSNIKQWFQENVVDKITGAFGDIPNKMFEIGKNLLQGLIDGVNSMIENVKNAVKNAVDSAVEGVKDFLGIHSPSKLMRDEIGKMMGEGIGEGILDSTGTVLKDAGKFTKQITAGLSATVPAINAGLSATAGSLGTRASGTVVTNNYVQTINAPKQPSRLELYRQTKNLLSLKGGY